MQPEFRYLRLHLRLSQKALAKLLGAPRYRYGKAEEEEKDLGVERVGGRLPACRGIPQGPAMIDSYEDLRLGPFATAGPLAGSGNGRFVGIWQTAIGANLAHGLNHV